MRLSRHFIDNWQRRVGNLPTVEMVRRIISQAVRVQRGCCMRLANGRHFIRLAIYWHPDLDLIITVDTVNNVAVSVLSRDVYRNRMQAKCSE